MAIKSHSETQQSSISNQPAVSSKLVERLKTKSAAICKKSGLFGELFHPELHFCSCRTKIEHLRPRQVVIER